MVTETLTAEAIRQYPLIRAGGDARSRGFQYGSQAATRVGRSIANYTALFRAYADLDWLTVRKYALRYERIVGEFDLELIEEMRGIAEGAAVEFADVLALNVRTEVMYGLGEVHASECTAFAALPSATLDGHTLVGQNWDWNPSAFDACVVLALSQKGRPSILTVVEAGLLAKMGMNDCGVGVCTNAMVTDLDQGAPGIPYHVMLRSILNSSSFDAAVDSVKSADRASSANFLIAGSEGQALDLEVAPGGPENVFPIEPRNGVVGHANQFVAESANVRDETAIKKPLGRKRQDTMDAVLGELAGRITVDEMKSRLVDHTNHPYSLCRHPLQHLDPIDRSATVASVIMDLDDRVVWAADGNPCEQPYRRYELESIFSPGA